MKDIFKKKYLEYEPKITLEIFTLVWNRLIELGYKSFNNYTVEYRYDEFKRLYRYFMTTEDHPNEFSCYRNTDSYTKITVEEILGYNPFIKDDFVLPKKWCIKIQANGIPYEVAQWRKSSWLDPGYMSSSGTWHCDNAIGYPEITLDQFKKYVLKETKPSKDWSKATEEELLEEAKRRYPIGCKVKLIKNNIGGDFKNEVRLTKHSFYISGYSKKAQLFVDGNLLLFNETIWAEIESLSEVKVKDETKEIIPEYIECIKPQSCYFIPGIVYKVLDTKCRSSCKIISNIKCSHYEADNPLWVSLSDTSYFKSSTKEAFDAQIEKEPTRLSFYVKYCDEFTEDLLKSLIEWSQKNTTLENRGRDNSFKGLKEDGYFLFDNFGLAAPKSRLYKDRVGYSYGVDNNTQGCFQEYSIKEVKELIGYKEPTKSIEKWSVGSYIVPLQDRLLTRTESLIKGKPYQIIKYTTLPYIISEKGEQINFIDDDNTEKNEGIKWFATKSEAEEFAKTLVESDNTIECETCNGTGEVMTAKLYPNGHTEVNEECPICGGSGIIDEPEQPLKQAVHCKTQEEWDFVTEKLEYKWSIYPGVDNSWNKYGNKTFINLSETHFNSIDNKNYNYQIISFQEWCDLNGYKMEKELKPDGHPDKNGSVKDTVILNESSIGKFISFKYRNDKFYNKALIVKENDSIYLLNNCHPNNDGHKDKSIYKYSLKFNSFNSLETCCKEIKFLIMEEPPKKVTKLNEIEFTYLPEPN